MKERLVFKNQSAFLPFTAGEPFSFAFSLKESPKAPQKPAEILPLPMIPLERRVNPKLVSTAIHEFYHATLAGFDKVAFLSVRPEADSLGRVIFRGFSLSAEDLKLAAAGGAVALPDKPASGFSSDLLTLALIAKSQGLDPKEEISRKISEAERKLAAYPPSLLSKIGEIIAYLGEVSGWQLTLIEERAKAELNLPFSLPFKNFPSASLKEEELTTQIIYYPHSYAIITEKRESKFAAEIQITLYCPLCQGINNLHHPSCPTLNRSKREKDSFFPWEERQNSFPHFEAKFT